MMHMTFYWGTKVTVLFDFWKTETWADYSLTLVACFLFSFFYQYLELRRIQFKHLPTSVSALASGTVASSALEAPLIVRPLKLAAVVGRSVWLWKFSSAVLFGINSAIGYMLMLAVMSFNGGVFLAVVVGLSVGHLVFRSSPSLVEDVAAAVDNPCACA